MLSSTATKRKLVRQFLSGKQKCRKRTAFVIVLEGRVIGDEDKTKVTEYESKLI